MSSASGPTSSVVGNAPGAAGSYTLSVMLSDSVGSPSTPQGCTLTIGYSQLTIQGVCPASSLTVPVTLSVPLTATGGQSRLLLEPFGSFLVRNQPRHRSFHDAFQVLGRHLHPAHSRLPSA